jgi:hypothetical protein
MSGEPKNLKLRSFRKTQDKIDRLFVETFEKYYWLVRATG